MQTEFCCRQYARKLQFMIHVFEGVEHLHVTLFKKMMSRSPFIKQDSLLNTLNSNKICWYHHDANVNSIFFYIFSVFLFSAFPAVVEIGVLIAVLGLKRSDETEPGHEGQRSKCTAEITDVMTSLQVETSIVFMHCFKWYFGVNVFNYCTLNDQVAWCFHQVQWWKLCIQIDTVN